MKTKAKALDFEGAIQLRNELDQLKNVLMQILESQE
jgi:excinuclease UvrABC helicase subunit UvrB